MDPNNQDNNNTSDPDNDTESENQTTKKKKTARGSNSGTVIFGAPNGNSYAVKGQSVDEFKKRHGVDDRWTMQKKGKG